jgi:predicted DNA-binding protein (MmcQ/YjbR family)
VVILCANWEGIQMNIEQLRDYCLSKKGVEECFPFDETTLVFKVMGKMFLLTGIDSKPVEFNVKCDPDTAIQLREKYDCVSPGFHMSKTHWNTVICDGSIQQKLLKQWIDHSYAEVVKGLTKKLRQELESL